MVLKLPDVCQHSRTYVLASPIKYFELEFKLAYRLFQLRLHLNAIFMRLLVTCIKDTWLEVET